MLSTSTVFYMRVISEVTLKTELLNSSMYVAVFLFMLASC